MNIQCTILWWDTRDRYGIAVSPSGDEHYIDTSVIDRPELCRDGVELSLEPHMLGTALCGKNVKVSLKSAVERQQLTVAVLERYTGELRADAIDEAKTELSRLAALLIRSEAC